MTIGVSIDDVLRDSITKFKTSYEDTFELELPESLVFDLTPNSLVETSLFKTELDAMSFLYEQNSLEIFGHSKESYRGVMVDLNELQNKCRDDNHTILLISKEHGNSIPATLFFLSKTSCKIRNYKFVSNDSDVWDHCDLMITTNKTILLSKPENKISIKILSDTNRDIKSDYEFSKLKDIIINQTIDNVFIQTTNYDNQSK